MAVAAAQYRCGDARRRRFVRDASPATINGIDFLEVGPDQKTLEVTFLHNLPGETNGVPASPPLGIGNVVVDGGVRITGIHVTQVASVRQRPHRHRRRVRRLLDLRAAPPDLDHGRLASGHVRPPAFVRPVLVQGRLPERLRLRRPGLLPSRGAARAGDRLPRQGLRQLPAVDARPDGRARTRLDGAKPGRRPRRARRAARVRRRPPQLLPGRGRDGELSRHRATTRLGSPPRAPARLPRPLGLQRPGVGRLRRRLRQQRRRAGARRRSRAPLTRRHRRDDRRAGRPAEAAGGGAADGVRDHVSDHAPRRAQRDRLLHLERRPVLPAEGRDPRDAEGRPDARPRGRRRRPLRGDPQPDHRARGRRRPDASSRCPAHARGARCRRARRHARARDRLGRRRCASVSALHLRARRLDGGRDRDRARQRRARRSRALDRGRAARAAGGSGGTALPAGSRRRACSRSRPPSTRR